VLLIDIIITGRRIMQNIDDYYNILFISTYEEMAKRAELVSKDLGIEVDIIRGLNLSNSVQAVRKRIQNRVVDAIITRGGTALKMKEEFNIPVIEIEVTILDILKAIGKVKKHVKRIGVIGFPNIIGNISSLSEFLDIEIIEIQINSIQESTEAVRKASQLQVDAIVGDRIAVETAAEFGIYGELIVTDSYECIAKSFYKAIEIANMRKNQLAKAEELRLITELTQSGIIAIDKDGMITLFNAKAGRILNIKPELALNEPVDKIIPGFNLTRTLVRKQNEFDEIVNVNDKYIVLHKAPILINEVALGAVATFDNLEQIQLIEKKARKKLSEKGHVAKFTFDSILGNSKIMKDIKERAKKYSLVDSAILIHGETGTGKEVFAQSIHNHSLRRNGPFVAVNCAALPYSLLESELFGYVKGAFTGAKEEGKAGLFEQAHKGTIFLDEIAEIPLDVQARLLRVLQEGQVQRIGDDRIINIDIRIISATNKNLADLIKLNKFREDLYYRLNVLNINLPSLRERIEDIPIFIDHFITLKSKEHKKIITKVDDIVILKLSTYSWPGNVRQLENIVERLVVESSNGVISINDLNNVLGDEVTENMSVLNIDEITKKTIETALKLSNNNKTLAAKTLGIDRTTLWRMMKRYNMS